MALQSLAPQHGDYNSTHQRSDAAMEQLETITQILGLPISYFAKHAVRGTIGARCDKLGNFTCAISALHRLGYDCFCHINPTKAIGKKASRFQITSFNRILVDLDPTDNDALVWEAGFREDLRGCFATVGVVQESLSIISTGRGVHCYIHLTPLTLNDDIQRLKVERATAWFLRRIAATLPDSMGARLDCTTSDLARVARCPGTINTKCGRMARIIRPATTRMPMEFTDWLLSQAPPQRLPEQLGPSVFSSNLWRLLPHLTERAQEFLSDGAPEGQRHHNAYATSKSLRERGVSYEQALTWVQLGGSKCRPFLTEEECLGPVRSAYR